jgi:hypothetical protein
MYRIQMPPPYCIATLDTISSLQNSMNTVEEEIPLPVR